MMKDCYHIGFTCKFLQKSSGMMKEFWNINQKKSHFLKQNPDEL